MKRTRLQYAVIYIAAIFFWIVVYTFFLTIPRLMHRFDREKSITVFTWPLIIPFYVVTEFEKETGIKVYLNYYETNADLYSKLRVTEGRSYDLVIPSDYMVQRLITDGILKKIDYTKLPFFSRIRKDFLGHYFDPQNEYSIPYHSAVLGLAIDRQYFHAGLRDVGWELLFDVESMHYDVGMTDDSREAILLAGLYLYGSIDRLDEVEKQSAIVQLLRKQKKRVALYSDARLDELLITKASPVVLISSADAWQIIKEYSNYTFHVPVQGSFITIDSFVIPQSSKKEQYVYQFIRYLYQERVLRDAAGEYGFYAPLEGRMFAAQEKKLGYELNFQKLDFFRNVIPPHRLYQMWLAILS